MQVAEPLVLRFACANSCDKPNMMNRAKTYKNIVAQDCTYTEEGVP